jgi:hypothetical protein
MRFRGYAPVVVWNRCVALLVVWVPDDGQLPAASVKAGQDMLPGLLLRVCLAGEVTLDPDLQRYRANVLIESRVGHADSARLFRFVWAKTMPIRSIDV